MNVNKAIILGRVTKDPELRSTNSGQSVAKVGIATNNYWTDKSGQKQEKTEFHSVILWGKLAELASKYITKGQEVYVEGVIETRSYTSKDNIERRMTEIRGEVLQFGARKNQESSRVEDSHDGGIHITDEDV